ncbi:MAG TPA: nuclear transport factor 2 family protein [Sphingomonas sp.]
MTDPQIIVTDFFATFSRGDVDGVLARMTDDATWWVSGRIEGMSGTNSKQALGELLRQVKPLYKGGALSITPLAFTVDGDRVAVEAESHAELANGGVYANQYHFLIELSDGLIRRVREYSDTQHMLETFSV